MSIRFGTSGWRSIIAEDFTFENVGRVTRAICRYLKKAEPGKAVIIGHDSRFMGEKFSTFSAAIAAEAGIDVLLCQGLTPTPTISHAIRSKASGGGINFTASHNPPEYQGIKFSTSDGAPALPEVTSEIEAAIAADVKDDSAAKGRTGEYDPKPAYLADLHTKIRFDVIAEAHGRFVFDPLWGTGRGYLDTVLRNSGLEVVTLHDWRDVTFGGQAPEPSEKHLRELKDYLLENQMTMGLATDGDADRFGIIDSDGTFITPNQLVALLTDYLAESRGWRSGVARSV
ncbi:MAG: phosphoglucomutase/phosphomannomutase family protein, partial [Acidobacteriota bacterium]